MNSEKDYRCETLQEGTYWKIMNSQIKLLWVQYVFQLIDNYDLLSMVKTSFNPFQAALHMKPTRQYLTCLPLWSWLN